MIDAKVLATGDFFGLRPVELWGAWIPRGGDNFMLTVEVVANYGVKLSVALYEKNYEEVGDGASAQVEVVFDEGLGRKVLSKTGVKELVRVQLTVERGRSLPKEDVGLALYRFLQPLWFERVA